MLMLFSLAISLVSVHSLFPLGQQAAPSNQKLQKQPVQQEKKESRDTRFVINLPGTVSITPTPLPAADNVWSVQIVSAGGLIGSGRGNVTLTSDGMMLRVDRDGSCSRRLSEETLQGISKAVFDANLNYSSDDPMDRFVCQDCIVTAMLIQRRKTAGEELTFTAFWHDGTQAKVAADIMNVYQSVMANRDCKLQ